jgi:hypothetical protein
MDPALIDMLSSGAVRYLRPEVLNPPAIYAPAPRWPVQALQANVIDAAGYMLPTSHGVRHLTSQEQQIFSSALRRSVKVVHAGGAGA